MSGIGSFLSSFFPTTHADNTEEKPADTQLTDDAAAEEPKEEEAEAEEPENALSVAKTSLLDTTCEERADCAPLKHHFEKCQAKVQAGEGFKGEDCIEEIVRQVQVHMMQACAAPQLFAKLR
ncbi:hypothetical protein FB451DRAFT_1399781 [Mycena latifolia]|nr:hypothetical protein FB451DRAFT_1415460 [Mycena latifolia]KAJ7471035.1 hypothetical protein FB451DRAFT_1399781 [Mycena latifolia]